MPKYVDARQRSGAAAVDVSRGRRPRRPWRGRCKVASPRPPRGRSVICLLDCYKFIVSRFEVAGAGKASRAGPSRAAGYRHIAARQEESATCTARSTPERGSAAVADPAALAPRRPLRDIR